MMPLQQLLFMIVLFLPVQDAVRKEMTPAGNTIERSFHNSWDYRIRWGNKQFMRSLPDTFTISGINNPFFWFENNQYILLKRVRAKGHYDVTVLPLNESSNVQKFDDPIDFNARLNLLAYISDSRTIKFVDLSNGKTGSITVRRPKSSTHLLLQIKSATLNNNELRIHWLNTPETDIKGYKIPKLK
jgi:hypothetical protein